MSNESYQHRFRYGALVKSTTGLFDGVVCVQGTHGENAQNAICIVKFGTNDVRWVKESTLRVVTFAEFLWWKDPVTGQRRIGWMGWVESLVIAGAILVVGSMTFTPIEGAWKYSPAILALGMTAIVYTGCRKNHKAFIRKPTPTGA